MLTIAKIKINKKKFFRYQISLKYFAIILFVFGSKNIITIDKIVKGSQFIILSAL